MFVIFIFLLQVVNIFKNFLARLRSVSNWRWNYYQSSIEYYIPYIVYRIPVYREAGCIASPKLPPSIRGNHWLVGIGMTFI